MGYDWLLVFMQANIHDSTVVKASKILFKILLANNQINLAKFKESLFYGGWLNNVANKLNSFKSNMLNNCKSLKCNKFNEFF